MLGRLEKPQKGEASLADNLEPTLGSRRGEHGGRARRLSGEYSFFVLRSEDRSGARAQRAISGRWRRIELGDVHVLSASRTVLLRYCLCVWLVAKPFM